MVTDGREEEDTQLGAKKVLCAPFPVLKSALLPDNNIGGGQILVLL